MQRVPVHSAWQADVGPMLSLGILTAAARHHLGGALNEAYEIHRPELADAVMAHMRAGTGPAVLLSSNYVWSLDHNLDLARRARDRRPELIVIHGGPSTPKYPGDAEAFLRRHRGVADILVHGEGELALCEILDVLSASDFTVDAEALGVVAGISFIDPRHDTVVRTAERPRMADLDQLPSPYLTGEFDDIDPDAWHLCASIETNRGCPYGCTFCDWGSATLARIRSFDIDRVAAEIEWCAARGIFGIQLCDANFGITRRDVDVAQALADAKRRNSAPTVVAFTPAKNTTRHLSRIFDILVDADVKLSTAISLQTTDPTTLALVDRSNISTDAYLALAADLRRRGQPLQGDVLMGMPGQTYESYRTDLQFFMDHDISPRTWRLRLLPNAPMNEPSYRAAHQIRSNDNDLIVSTATMTEHDRERMQRLRKVQLIAWRYGLLRHVLNVVQWDHGIDRTVVLEAIVAASTDHPRDHPALSWVVEYFDLYQVPAGGWASFYDDVRTLLADHLGIGESSSIDVAVELQLAVMPAPGRTFPTTVPLAHDYVTYLRGATRSLFESGRAGIPEKPLDEHPPASITLTGDPSRLCTNGLALRGDSRSEIIEGDFWIEPWLSYELPTIPAIPSAASPVLDEQDDAPDAGHAEHGTLRVRDMTADREAMIPVYAVFQESMGPLLSLGMLTAAARHWDGGALNERFEIRRPETTTEFLDHLRARRGPAILLSSDYVWSIDDNLEMARRAKAIEPDLFVIHGGPSAPKYEGDAERFLDEHGEVAQIIVRGEGERVLCRLLEVLAVSLPTVRDDLLREVDGITFRDATGRVVRTPDQERIADLDSLPSPYLTGEFDHLDASAWGLQPANVETNRGCPYGCTYCDWGSATLSRVRKFDVDRVVAECRWIAERSVLNIHFCDANFGMLSRDVEIAARSAEISREVGFPVSVAFAPAKNTTKHLTQIFDHYMDAGVLVSAAISLQTIDPMTLDAVDRTNIPIDTYVALAADLRRRGQPLLGDLIVGMPGQTYEAYKRDLQFFLDHEVMARTWMAKMLPNAPMNEPGYRQQFAIEVDSNHVVAATSTMSEADRSQMLGLRDTETVAERVGVLRHIMRVMQWDHGVPATDLMERVHSVVHDEPGRFPFLSWVFEYFDRLPTVALSWTDFYGDVRRFLTAEYGLDTDDSALDTSIRLQQFLMPAPGRRFPAEMALSHDYVAYYRSATDELFTSGAASTPDRPLAEYPPAVFRIEGDPSHLCTVGLRFDGDSGNDVIESDFHLFGSASYELDSPLLQLRTVMGGRDSTIDGAARAEARMATIDWKSPAEPTLLGRVDRIRDRRSSERGDVQEPTDAASAVTLTARPTRDRRP